jgi:hypothetical protein
MDRQEKVRVIQLTPERVAAFAIAEIGFLVTLTSADRTVSATASQCLRLIAGAERQRGSPPGHPITQEEKGKRYAVYESLGDHKALILGKRYCCKLFWTTVDAMTLKGRVADQKRIRKLIRHLALPYPAHVAVWEECYFRWRAIGEMAARHSLDPSDEDTVPMGDKSMPSEVI